MNDDTTQAAGEGMSEERLRDIGLALQVADGPTVAHELYAEVKRLRKRETAREAYVELLERSNATAAQMNGDVARRLAEIGETEVEWAADGPAGWMQWPFASEQFARGIVEQAAERGVTVKLMRRLAGKWREAPDA